MTIQHCEPTKQYGTATVRHASRVTGGAFGCRAAAGGVVECRSMISAFTWGGGLVCGCFDAAAAVNPAAQNMATPSAQTALIAVLTCRDSVGVCQGRTRCTGTRCSQTTGHVPSHKKAAFNLCHILSHLSCSHNHLLNHKQDKWHTIVAPIAPSTAATIHCLLPAQPERYTSKVCVHPCPHAGVRTPMLQS